VRGFVGGSVGDLVRGFVGGLVGGLVGVGLLVLTTGGRVGLESFKHRLPYHNFLHVSSAQHCTFSPFNR